MCLVAIGMETEQELAVLFIYSDLLYIQNGPEQDWILLHTLKEKLYFQNGDGLAVCNVIFLLEAVCLLVCTQLWVAAARPKVESRLYHEVYTACMHSMRDLLSDFSGLVYRPAIAGSLLTMRVCVIGAETEMARAFQVACIQREGPCIPALDRAWRPRYCL